MSVRSSRSRRLTALLSAAPLLAGALVAGPMAAGAHAAPKVRTVNFSGTVKCKTGFTPTTVAANVKGLGGDSADVDATGNTGDYSGLSITVADTATTVNFSATCTSDTGGSPKVLKKNSKVSATVDDGSDLTVNIP